MNILFSANTFFPQQGGAEQLAADLIQACQKKGHKTFLITQLLDKSLPELEQKDGLEIHRVEFPRRYFFGRRGKRKDIKRVFKLFFYHQRLIKSEKIDVIYVSHFGMNGLFPIMLKLFYRFKFITLLHASELRVHYKNHPIFRQVFRLGLDCSDEIICVSEKLRKELILVMPRVATKARVILNAVPTKEILASNRYQHPRPSLPFIGRLSSHKNVSLLIEAFSQISKEIPEYDLLIAGDGAEEEMLKELARSKDLASRVHFLGLKSRSDVFSLLQACAMLVLPSHSEGHPLVVLEAIAAGKICIGSNVKGINEIIFDRENGLLFEAGNALELSVLLSEYLKDTEKRELLEDKIKNLRESPIFDFDLMLKKHLATIESEKNLVTILMPCKDADVSMMKEAVASVFRQTSADWSLLIIDDHSTKPETLNYLKELSSINDPRVVVCKNKNKNLTGALNTGLSLAKTRFVAMLHCDDLLSVEAVECLTRYINHYPEVDYFHSSRRVVDDYGKFISGIKKSKQNISIDGFVNGGQVKHLHCYRVEKAISIGGMDENLGAHGADDYDFPWMMLEKGAVFKAVTECLYYYRDHRLHHRLTTHIPLSAQVDELKKIFKKHKLSDEQIEFQLANRKSTYLKQALFLDEQDKRQNEHLGLSGDGWRESY